MRKKLFYGCALFVSMFLLVTWQFAEAELAEIQSKQEHSTKKISSKIVFS